ncbi:protein BCL9 homolog [Nephila pilipes]|uniref:Protein BCL9 homolog n=1 Tax=Nephila pilipes TaxID=299642 RepID=A0A8X6MX56_NEPPI|nr:protein BCL9 homolog [Nephila pilipes]
MKSSPILDENDLEEALVEEESVTLADIFARLLRFVTGNLDILIANFDSFLRNLLIKEKAEISRFLDNGTTWHDLAPEEKLGTLKWLIDHVYQEKEEDIADFLDENYSADDLRGICAGHDAFNNVYWYLDDFRLYREFPHKKQNKRDWECVCLTLSDWQSFIKQFRKTSNLQEKELYTYLNFELYPIVEIQLLQKKYRQSKEEINKSLIKREQEDLDVMLEKRTFLECNNVALNPDVNGVDSTCIEKHNGALAPIKIPNISGNEFSDFLNKSEESDKNSTMNHCDGHLSINENVCSIGSSLDGSTMDIKPSTETNMGSNLCSTSCATPCVSNQDTSVYNNTNSTTCGKSMNCSTSPSAIATTSAMSLPQDTTQEVSLQQPLSDIPSDSSSVTSNKENAPPLSGNTGNEIPPMSAMSNMLGSTSAPATTASVQPLPSNMVNKTSFQMETQYMQQQSQIFVFSTALANKAAESYLNGQFPSIIAFHCAQPGTKSFLEKYPLKVQQFNRQNPAAWLNSLAQMKQTGRQMKTMSHFPGPHNLNSRFPGPSGGPVMSPCSGSCNMHSPGMCSTPRPPSSWSGNCGGTNMMPSMSNDLGHQTWSAQQFPSGSSTLNNRFPVPQGMSIRQMGPSANPLVGCLNNANPNVSVNFQNPNLTTMQLNQGSGGPLTGVKVPDENLTPQQRQHREEQLAMIRKMQQLLFPEQQHMEPVQGGMGPNMVPMLSGMPAQHTSHSRFGSGDMCVHPGVDACFSSHQSCMNDHEHPHPPSDMYMGNSMIGPGFSQQNFPGGSVSAQMEWQKLKHQFYEERCKKQVCGNVPLPHSLVEPEIQQTVVPQVQPMQTQQSMSQPQTPQQQTINSPSPSMGLSPGTRMQGPPPPYHQTNRRTMPSPHPASPNTSSLSLPSPHMASGLPSPADPSRQFPLPTPPGPRLPHPSPGPTTPVGSNSLHTTPLNSPKPLSTSGSASNGGTLIKTPTTPSNTASTPTSTPTSSCAPAICNSGPGTPASSCTSNRKQSQSCNSDIQDSNSVSSTTTLNTEFGSCPISTANNTQGDLFCHNMHACNQTSKTDNCAGHSGICPKEPSLMPVPSPQQIQYLNAFDGQELTIQKQPNTSIRDLDIMSPASIPPSIVMSAGSHSQYQSPEAVSFPNTPGSCPSVLENSQDSLSSRFPISAPASMDGNMTRFTAPSPQMPTFDSGPRHMIPPLAGNDNNISRFSAAANLEMRMPGPGSINPNPLDDGSGGRFSGPGPQGTIFGTGPLNNINIMPRFPNSTSDSLQRFRGPSPHANMDMVHSRFMGSGPQMSCVENLPQASQLNNIGPDSVPHVPHQSFQNSVQTMASSNGPCVGSSFIVDGNLPHSHLQNLQKMTPPFESISGNKISPDVISPLGQCSNSSVNGPNLSMPSYDGTNSLASSSQVGPSQRLSHFDPIASMAAMSESTVPLVSAAGNAQNSQNMIGSNINIQGNTGNSNQPNMINFHSNMQSIQNTSACSMPNQRPQYSAHNQMTLNTGCGTQTVNNTYVSTTMSMQPMSMQNVVTTAYNVNAQDPGMNSHPMHVGCQGNGANTISCSVTTNHPIMHTAVTTRTNSNIGVPGPRHGPQNFPGQPNIQRAVSPAGTGSPTMMVRGAPFNSANVQVKAGAPNTIQYLPARQQNATPVPGRGLEFLQRYAAPLTNLDNKVPTHNLQYFPNSGGSHPGVVYGGMNTNPPNVAPNMMNNPRPVNMMMGPMMRGTSPNASHPSGQIFPGPIGSGLPSVEPGMFGRPPCPTVNNQLIPMNAMGASQNVGMFPNKQMPLPMGGMAPDTTQPLPPSMGQSFNYKQSPFYGPTTADPNYAVQFHNFQQQLYATNTKGSQMNLQNNMTGPGFFGAK